MRARETNVRKLAVRIGAVYSRKAIYVLYWRAMHHKLGSGRIFMARRELMALVGRDPALRDLLQTGGEP